MSELREAFISIESKLRDLFNRVNQLEAAPTVTSSSGGGAPVDAQYLTLAFNATLTQERRIDFSARFATIDGGANNDYDVDLATTGVISATYGSATQVPQFTVDAHGRLTAASNVAISGVPPVTHALLGTYHNDTSTNTVSRGSIIIGNSTPLWDELIHPAGANYILTTDANDVVWSSNTLNITGNSTINGNFIGGGTVDTATFTGTIPSTGTFAMGAGTLTTTTTNNVAIANHTHAITTSSDGTTNPSTIAAFNTGGQLTASDFFVNDGGVVGINGNERIEFNAAGTIEITGAVIGIDYFIYRIGDLDTYIYFLNDTFGIVTGGVLTGQFNYNLADGAFYATGHYMMITGFGSPGNPTLWFGNGFESRIYTDISDSSIYIQSNDAGSLLVSSSINFEVDTVSVFSIEDAGEAAYTNITGVSVEDGDFIGNSGGARFVYDSSADDLIYTPTAYVGIGCTPSTTYQLEIEGIGGISFERQSSNFGAYLRLARDGGGEWTIHGGVTSGNDDFAIRDGTTNVVLIEDTAPSNSLYIDSSGNIGLGISTPGASLHINKSVPRIQFTDTDTNADSFISASSSFGSLFIQADANDEVGSSRIVLEIDGDEVLRLSPSWSAFIAGENAQSTQSGLDIQSGGLGLVVGADYNATTRTNNTNKSTRICWPHYTNSEEPVCIASPVSTSTENRLNLGGGASLTNTATSIEFYTAANNTTLTGTKRVEIVSDGGVYMYYLPTGATQAAAGAGTDELWVTNGHATLPDNVVMIGV